MPRSPDGARAPEQLIAAAYFEPDELPDMMGRMYMPIGKWCRNCDQALLAAIQYEGTARISGWYSDYWIGTNWFPILIHPLSLNFRLKNGYHWP
jgi:hypothetical protein